MKEYNGIINISKLDDDYIIYKMYSSNQNDKSIYIGVTSNYKERIYKHSMNRYYKRYSNKPLYIWINNVLDKQKEKVIFEIIKKELSEEIAFNKEVEYIQKYKDLDYLVLNISEGGRGNTGSIPWNKGKIMNNEWIKMMSTAHIGSFGDMTDKHHTQETKDIISLKSHKRKERGWRNPRKNKVYKYTLDGKLIIVYSCLEEAAFKENTNSTSIGEWCRGTKKPRNNFTWSYKEIINN